MGEITQEILKEYDINTKYVFDEVIPNRYGFIFRDTTKFPTPEDKWTIIEYLEKLRLKSGGDLPIELINPQMLVCTQETVDSDNLKKIAKNYNKIDKLPFVVKFHGILYLLDGHHRTTVALVTRAGYINARVLDLDSINIGLDRRTSYGN